MPAGDKWVDRNAGPVVRPYALTGGRTEPASGAVLDVITVIVATTWAQQPDDWLDLSPEHRRILGLCRRPVTVADVASTTALPLSEWSASCSPTSSCKAGSPHVPGGRLARSPVPPY
jgi:hypothetical protein